MLMHINAVKDLEVQYNFYSNIHSILDQWWFMSRRNNLINLYDFKSIIIYRMICILQILQYQLQRDPVLFEIELYIFIKNICYVIYK